MLAALIVVSRLLGLVANDQPIDVRVDPSVRSVRILVDGKALTTLRSAPWRAVIHFGPEIAPHEVVAIAYDAEDNEVARDTQLVNLARPPAEAVIDLDRKDGQLRATVQWQHIGSEKPKRVEIKLDGKTIATGTPSVVLPDLPTHSIHALQAEVEFAGGFVARKEVVFGGQYAEEVPAELTAFLIRGKADCLSLDGKRITPRAIEKPEATILFVRSSDPSLARNRLKMPAAVSREGIGALNMPFRLEGARMRYIWPKANEIRVDERQSVVNLFLRTDPVNGTWGTQRMLTLVAGPTARAERFADAVAVAGVQTLAGGRRRAVVLVLGGERDDSRHDPRIVRRYLERIGVTLHVWSLTEVTPEMSERWGDVKAITGIDGLRRATLQLRNDLKEQQIAWLAVQPMDALRVVATDCSANASE